MNELPDNALSTLRLLASTQMEVDAFSDQLIQSVKSGATNPLEILVMLRAFEKVSERVIKEIMCNVLTEADKYPGQSFEYRGNKIEKAEVGVKYDYDACGDTVYEQRQSALKAAEALVKERTDFLRALKQPMTVVDEDNGEVVTIRPPLKKATQSVKVSIR